MADHKWIDKSQPQTLQAAVFLAYFNAALAVVTFLVLRAGLSLMLVLLAGAAYGIANERRWAYWAAVVLSCLYLLGQLIVFVSGGGLGGLLNLVFAVVLVALLLHPMSRHYEQVWFH